MGLHYGEIARSNGLLFEQIITDYYNNNENHMSLLISKISNYLPDVSIEILKTGRLIKCGSDKVESIYDKKTTRKSDIYFNYKNGSLDTNIGISVKMSNKGTQLQVISLKCL